MLKRRPVTGGALIFVTLASPLLAQHAGHDVGAMSADSAPRSAMHLVAQAIPLVTRATPTAGGVDLTQVALAQLVVMGGASFLRGRGALNVALNGEGLTMPNGELNTGAYGEGFVDRRHPHTYVHELTLTGRGAAGPLSFSATAGRGFASFGTDDPMVRPMVKYPINHHLSQILERGAVIGALRVGPAILEGSTFGGDEPQHPSSVPRASRFGDSWSTRATLLPASGAELQASYARVASPEEPGGQGLDQRKQSISARMESRGRQGYLLAEWARTLERDHDRNLNVFRYESALVEGAARAGPLGIALRLEQTDRPEEERLSDPWRTPRPASDLSINGITRLRAATLQLAAPAVTRGAFSGFPFLEVGRLIAASRDPRYLFTPQRLYGTSRFWMITAGVRLRAGDAHARMGRYGVALPTTTISH